MPSLFSMNKGTIGYNNRTTSGKPGLFWKVLVGKSKQYEQRKESQDTVKHLEIMLQ